MKVLKNRRGQSIVEISLITPLLLVALYIPADFGVALFTAHLTQNTVRELARIGVSDPAYVPMNTTHANDLRDLALDPGSDLRLPRLLSSPQVIVRYNASGSAGCMITLEVEARGNYNFFAYQLMRLVGFDVPDSRQIVRRTRMRYQAQPATNGPTQCAQTFAVT